MGFSIFLPATSHRSFTMAALLHIGRPGISPELLGIRLGVRNRRFSGAKSLSFRCGPTEDDDELSGKEPTESMFMKELKRRGMERGGGGGDGRYNELGEMEAGDESGDGRKTSESKSNGVASAEYEKKLENQREISMALNSEGLEGLIPRAKLLLSLGGSFFLGFGPLILVTITLFTGLYFYLGPTFVHGASKSSFSPPQYVDPYQLLEDDRISQMSPPPLK